MAIKDELRTRFLIALAKFFGENPTEPKPLAGVQLCQDWFLDELLAAILNGETEVHFTPELFNQLMLNCRYPMASDQFFRRFFGSVRDIDSLEAAVEDFRVRAMWLFGNFKFAYRRLATTTVENFTRLIARTEPQAPDQFQSREHFAEIEDISDNDLGYLGYLSGRELDNIAMAVDTVAKLLASWTDRGGFIERLGGNVQSQVAAVLQSSGTKFPTTGSAGDETGLRTWLANTEQSLKARRERQAEARRIGLRNTQRYLTMPYLDVYVATSMRTPDDYVAQHRFVKEVFGSPSISDLKLRYFDPTLSYDPDRITKGVIEGLMLRRARVTIYNAQAEDTMGKDSELAATLAQGKPVIVYVQSEPRFVKVAGREQPVDMDRRASMFQADHPLGLQISTTTGVAHGIVVVRTVEQCSKMLRKVLLHDLRFSIIHENGNHKLIEEETKSVLRVVSDNPLLTHAFWTYFRRHEPETDI